MSDIAGTNGQHNGQHGIALIAALTAYPADRRTPGTGLHGSLRPAFQYSPSGAGVAQRRTGGPSLTNVRPRGSPLMRAREATARPTHQVRLHLRCRASCRPGLEPGLS